MSAIDLTSLTDEELAELRQRVTDERTRRSVIASVEREADILTRRYAEAVGRKDGDEWVQPTSGVDAYALDATVTHDDKLWASLISANVWEPGISGWREVSEEEGTPADWVQPNGGHDAYGIGDQVSFDGTAYESVIDGNVWSPADYPQGWRDLS